MQKWTNTKVLYYAINCLRPPKLVTQWIKNQCQTWFNEQRAAFAIYAIIREPDKARAVQYVQASEYRQRIYWENDLRLIFKDWD